jgi:aromatic-L-amino-acid/L-tryptophan decarboxylase
MTDSDLEEFRRRGYAAIDWIVRYREGLEALPVRPDMEPGWLRAKLAGELPEQPGSFDALLQVLDDAIVPASTHWQHPSFFGYFPSNASLNSLLGDMIAAGLGPQGMMWATSPAVTELEQTLLDGLARALGLDHGLTFAGGGGGVIQDSASSAVLVAVLAALHRTSAGAWRTTGVDGLERIYLTSETHSSVAKATRVAGLGERALRIVRTEPGTYAMSPSALREALQSDVDAGLRPVLVCPTIGTTSTGAVDPVRELALAARAHGAWVHVDAAWAGAAALCPEHRHLIDGVELADSLTVNAHKWLLTAFDASLLWVRDATALPAALAISPEYLRNPASETGAVVDYRDWQVPLGRRFRALKLWAVVQGYGLDGLRRHIRFHVALAEQLADRIREHPHFALVTPPSLGLLCLHVVTGAGVDADNHATQQVLERVNDSGRALLTHTTCAGRFVIRVAIGGTATESRHVEALWERLQAEATAVIPAAPGANGRPAAGRDRTATP